MSTAYLTSLRGLPATLERLRIDCQLAEALATGFDPLHLAEVFGMSEHTAIRYAVNARQLNGPGPQAGPPAPPGAAWSRAAARRRSLGQVLRTRKTAPPSG